MQIVDKQAVPPSVFAKRPAGKNDLDRWWHARQAPFTKGVSPAAMGLAFADWWMHFQGAPAHVQTVLNNYAKRCAALALQSAKGDSAESVVEPGPNDHRFQDETWKRQPFHAAAQSFLLLQQCVHELTTGIPGTQAHSEHVVSFALRQWLDMFSPSNFLMTNPEVLVATHNELGQNLARGATALMEDLQRQWLGKPPVGTEAFRPGYEIAATPGRVVYRNRLIEVLHYAPSTEEVQKEPILIVPAWIMKYYILDLSEHNSMVKYLRDQGHSVFMISWHNPDAADRDLGMQDYLELGILSAIAVISQIYPEQKINAVGYCLGGTLLSIAAAFLGRENKTVLNSVTLLASQTDFSDAGELTLFIDESELNYLEDMMWEQGYLDTTQMAGAFQLLRSTDLIWSNNVRKYLLGKGDALNDMMAWNADATRMPCRMHSEYLRKLFLNNDLSEGRYEVYGAPVTLREIRVPVFAVGTETDHVSPWRSVYKIHFLTGGERTFVLTSGGHNAGIVSEPGHKGRHYRIGPHHPGDAYVDPQRWVDLHSAKDGSWWPAWSDWLKQHNSGTRPAERIEARADIPFYGDAPGLYVLER